MMRNGKDIQINQQISANEKGEAFASPLFYSFPSVSLVFPLKKISQDFILILLCPRISRPGLHGCRSNFMSASSGVRSFFRWLHSKQQTTQFSQLLLPPRLRGKMWST